MLPCKTSILLAGRWKWASARVVLIVTSNQRLLQGWLQVASLGEEEARLLPSLDGRRRILSQGGATLMPACIALCCHPLSIFNHFNTFVFEKVAHIPVFSRPDSVISCIWHIQLLNYLPFQVQICTNVFFWPVFSSSIIFVCTSSVRLLTTIYIAMVLCIFGFVSSHISGGGSFGRKNGDFICGGCHLATSCIRVISTSDLFPILGRPCLAIAASPHPFTGETINSSLFLGWIGKCGEWWHKRKMGIY